LNTFQQALVNYAYDRQGPALKYLHDMAFLICLYDHFVHHHMFKLLKKETRNSGSVQAISEINPQYQNRRRVSFSHLFSFYHIFYHLLYQLADLRCDFLIRNRYPQRYIKLITPGRTSDDEADPDGQKEDEQLIYWIKRRPECSTSMEKFIRLLDKKREEETQYDYTKRCCQDRLRCMPSEPQDTAFPTIPQGVPVDYYDPEFFSQLQPQLCHKIANKSIALLPDIEETFTYSQDEQLSDKAFMQKYGKDILARYKLDDLSNVESEEILADKEDFDETEEMEY